jgi:hypothetical protein
VLAELESASPVAEDDHLDLDVILGRVKCAADAVSQKAASEAADYKDFIHGLASGSATAGGTSLFSSTAKVSDAESAYLAKLKAALGL